MKFVLVNHRTPRKPCACAACSLPLERGFLHDLSTRRRYCGIECYPVMWAMNSPPNSRNPMTSTLPAATLSNASPTVGA